MTLSAAIGVVASFTLQPVQAQYAGATWNGIPAFGFNNLDGLSSRLSQDGEVGIFGCWGGPVFHTLDGGTTWNQTLTGITPNGIAMSSNGSKIFLAVRDFAIHVSTNSGANWSVVSGLPGAWNDVDCSSDGQMAIACRDTGSVYVTTNGGLTSGDWTEQTIPGASNINFVACSSDGTKRFAASSNGFIYTWDSVSGWVQRDSSRQWAGLTSSADGTKLAATVLGGNIYTSTDSGATWTARATAQDWTRIDSTSDGSVLITSASGLGGGLFTSNDSGVTWTARATGVAISNPFRWRGTSVSGDGTRMLAPIGGGTAPQALYMSDTSPGPSQAPAGTDKTVTATGGTYSFTKTDFGFTDADSPSNNFTAVKITTVPGGSLTLGGNPVTVGQVIPVTTLPAGETWTSTAPPSDYPTSFALSEDGSTILMTGWNGGIYRSTDGGTMWTNRLSATFRGAVAITPDGTRAIAVHRPNGAVYTSTDSGETFVSQGTSRNYTSIAISNDGMKAIAGTDGDSLFLTTDGGITWNAVTDPVAGTGTWTDVASSADGTKLIASKYNGFLYTSTDSGATWTARDVARAWFGVSSSADGTKLAAAVNGGNIYTSADSGATWTPRATGQGWATINSSSDGNVLIATLGIGNLYTSTDAGLTWTARDSSRNWVASGVSYNGGKMIAGVGGASGGLPAGGPQAFLSNGPPPVFPVWTGSSNTSFTFQVRDDGSTANGGVTEDPTPNTMTIQLPNVAPTDISLSSTAINENAGVNGVVGALTATDGDSGDTHTFTLVAGSGDTDNGSFNINGTNLRLNASADYETKTSYSVRIQADDGKGGLYQKEFTITVNNLNDIAPEITAVSRYLITGGANANANAMRLMRLNADGSAILSNTALPSLALTGGSANAVYNPTSGYLVFGSNALNLNSYLAGGSFAVSGIAGLGNNAPWSAHLPSGRFVTPRRNGTGNAPVETFNPLTGTITSGANHGAFIPEASWIYNGNLYNLNEGYTLLQIPVAADGSTTGSMTSAPTNFTSALGIPHGNGTYTEVSRLAIDPSDGTALFSNGFQNLYLFDFDGPYAPGGYTLINLYSHLLTSGDGFTYNPALTNGSNVTYDSAAEVFYAAGSLSNGTDYRGFLVRITKAGAVTVLAQELAGDPVYTGFLAGLAYAQVSGNAFSLTENSVNGSVVGTLSATDGDAGATTFSDWTITGGNTGGAFAINASSGQITVANSSAVDFETTPVFNLTVTVSDGVNTSAPISVTINLTDANEPATDITLSGNTILENAATNTVVGTLAATGDPDAGATHTFSLVAGTGSTDNAAFNINGNDLRLTGSANFEAKNSYSIRLRATDNLGATYDEVFAITVVNVNEPPTSISLSATSLPENGGADAVVGTISAIGDPDVGSAHTFELVAGTGDEDNSAFNVSTHFLRLTANGDFEVKPSYSIRLRANDGLGGSVEQEFTITLTDVNEPPTGLNLSNSSIDENIAPNSTVGSLTATGDPDAGASHAYSLVPGAGDTDNAAFNILGNALRLTGVADFETKASYSVRIQASDGLGGTFADAYTITVNNLPEGANDITLTNASLPENNTPPTTVGTLAAIGDPNPGDAQTLSLVSGTGSTDNGSFLIDGTTLRLNVAANFEAKSSYSIRVQADDGNGGLFAKVLTISITNVNEPPTDLSLSNTILPENSGANAIIGTVAALGDPDAGATHVFTLVTGTGSTDNTLFNLTGSTLRKVTNADYEDRTSYSIRIRADDGLGGVFEKPFTITVTDVNEAPTDISLSGDTVPENAGANVVIGSLAALGDPDAGASHTFSLVAGTGGTDNAAFTLLGASLRLTASADFEAKPNYSIRVRASDGIDGIFEKVFTISVTNVNEAPTDISLSNATVPENAGANAVVGTVAAVGDPDAGATHSYSLVAGAGDTDNAAFNLSGASLRLTASADFETKASYTVRVRADDGAAGTFEKAFTITVTNVNEAPTDLTINDATVDENAGANAIVGSFTTVGDPDAGAVHTYTLVSGVDDDDNTAFNINGANLRLTASANFEVKSSYKVRVRTDDGQLGTFEKAFTITVNNVNEAPTDLTLGNSSVPENAGANAVVGILTATGDPDAGATHSYALVAGTGDTDNAAFNIDGASLRLTASADFEVKSSYSVRVRADDGLGGTFDKAFTISVTNVNEAPTDISLSNASIPENGGINALVGDLSAIGDPDAGATHTFALVSGAGSTDNAAFILSGNSLRLSASADFETKSSYSVRVEANDGLGGTFAKAFTISITNVNEAPTDISLSNTTVPENGGANLVVGSLAALGDPDAGATHAFSLVAGTGSTDNAAFNIDGTSLRLSASADFEVKSSYSVRVEANDGLGGTFAKAFTILISNVNEPPTDISLSNNSVPENAGINALVGNLSALGDPDGGATHSFSLVAGTGSTDNSDFNISGASLRLNASANFEVKALYQIRVRADDGAGGTYEKPFVVNITDVNEAPSVTNVSASGDEDAPGITVTFSGSDPDSNPLTYSIVTGPLPAEGTLGAIAANTVVFTPAANFNGVVNFTYKATDGSLESNTGTATVTVNAVNDAPTITDISGLSILEDGTTGPLAFTIGDVDAGAVLSVSAWTNNQTLAPDGELVLGGSGTERTITVTPEPDQNGAVTVTVQVSDGLLTDEDSFVLTVTPVNDEPTFDLSTSPLFSALDPNAEGRLWAWGSNNDGQLGDGSVGTASQPVQVGSQTDWRKVVTGDNYTLAIKSDGTLWAWGDNFYGQLGDGTTTDRDVPVRIGEEDDWESVHGGDGHVVALKRDGTLWAWGRNDYGQLGDGATSPLSVPQQIGSSTDWRAVSAGSLHTVALKSDGSMWAWGRNQFGQLGTGSTANSSVPVRIGSANDWLIISAGGLHTLAMKDDGSLWAWGRNADGQLGDGTNNQSNAPKQIGLDTDWVQIASGYTYSLAQKNDSSIWAWGRNADGQAADGTRTNRLAPQQVGVDTDWALIAAGRNHALALKSDGSLWTWGDNDTYQMGIGTIGDLLVPTRLGTETWSAIAGGLGHSLAIEAESMRLTVAANSGPFLLPGFATNILAGPLDEQSVQNVTFEVSNDNNGLFVTQPAIAPDGSLTLTPGVDAGTLTVTARAKDDGGVANGGDDTSVPKTFSITITVAPEITLTGNSVEILNGDDTPDAADHTDFEETPTVGGSVVRTFTIFNDGTAPLLLGNISLNGSTAFSVTTPPASNTVDRLGGFQTFSITFDPATPGLHTTEVSIVSDDDDENPFVFDLAGIGITPEISITGNSTEITNGDSTPDTGDHTDFGSTEVTGGSVSRTFTILNTGTQDLTLSGEPLVSLSGSAAFSVTTAPATNPVPRTNGSTSFVVLFDPSSRGAHTAVVSIANNDEDEAPYTFTIRGLGLAPEISVTGNASEIPSGDTTPSVFDDTLFGSIGAAMVRTYTIVNEGNLLMNLGSPAVTISGSASFSVQSQPGGSTVAADRGTQTFSIAFDPTSPGEQSAIVSIASDDTDENPYTFTIRGNGLTQVTVSSFRAVIGSGRINLATLVGASPAGGIFSGPGVDGGTFNPNGLAPGDYTLKYTVKDAIGQDLETDITVTVELSPARLSVGRPKSFATTTVGSSSRPQTIGIDNLGGKPAESVRVVLSGKGRKDFRIKQPGSTIQGGGKTSFEVTFAPRKTGVRKAKITILSSAGPVSINLSGRAAARKSNASGHLPGG